MKRAANWSGGFACYVTPLCARYDVRNFSAWRGRRACGETPAGPARWGPTRVAEIRGGRPGPEAVPDGNSPAAVARGGTNGHRALGPKAHCAAAAERDHAGRRKALLEGR